MVICEFETPDTENECVAVVELPSEQWVRWEQHKSNMNLWKFSVILILRGILISIYVSCFPPEDWWSRKQPMKFHKNINRNSDWSNLASTLLAFRQLLGQRSRGQWRFCPVTLTGTEWVWMFAFNPIKILVVHGTIPNPTPQNTNTTHHDDFWWIIQRSINWLCVTKLIINAAKMLLASNRE